MSKPTNYQLLKDIHEITGRLDKKYDKKFTAIDKRQDVFEGKMNNMAGKVGISVMFVTVIVTGVFTLIFDFIKKTIFKI